LAQGAVSITQTGSSTSNTTAFRALCHLEQGRCRLVSRNGNIMRRFEALGEQMAAALGGVDAILDGEVIA